jgi:hypothetical protein
MNIWRKSQLDYETDILWEHMNVNKGKLQEDRRRMHNEQIHNLYHLHQIKEGWMIRSCSIHGKDKNIFTKFCMENLKGRDHIGTWPRMWQCLWDIGYGLVNWIQLAQDRVPWQVLLNMVQNHQVQLKVWIFFTSRATVSFSRRTLFGGVN